MRRAKSTQRTRADGPADAPSKPTHPTGEAQKSGQTDSSAMPEDQQTRESHPADASIFTFNPMRFFSELNGTLDTDHEVSGLLSVEGLLEPQTRHTAARLEDLQAAKRSSASDRLSMDARGVENESSVSFSHFLQAGQSERRLAVAAEGFPALLEELSGEQEQALSAIQQLENAEEAETPSWRVKPDLLSRILALQSTDLLLAGRPDQPRFSRMASATPNRRLSQACHSARIQKGLWGLQSEENCFCRLPSDTRSRRFSDFAGAPQSRLEAPAKTSSGASSRVRENQSIKVPGPAAAVPGPNATAHLHSQRHPTAFLFFLSLVLLLLGALCD